MKLDSKETCPSSILSQLHNYWGIREVSHESLAVTYCSETEYFQYYPEQLESKLNSFNKARLQYSPNHGNLQNSTALNLIINQFLNTNFSATQFENYQKCPHSFFRSNF